MLRSAGAQGRTVEERTTTNLKRGAMHGSGLLRKCVRVECQRDCLIPGQR